MSIRCQINRRDEVCTIDEAGAERFWPRSGFTGTMTQSEANVLAEGVDSDGSSSAWIHAFFMNLLLHTLNVLIKDILGPTFLCPILRTVQKDIV